ncbi:MAG: polysaccharide deacetylase family protein [Candidatus Aminicenantales bacterium]
MKKNMRKPAAALSMDLDNLWSYLKVRGHPGWKAFPSYFDAVIPRALEIFDEFKLKVTFFVVGQDAALEKNSLPLSSLTGSGHEVGNHSFGHEPWLHLYSGKQLEEDILKAEKHIIRVCGQKPVGFRGPGYSLHPGLMEILKAHDYQYDATVFPTYLGPLARRFYFALARLNRKEQEQRKNLFGGLRHGLRPVKPFYWTLPAGRSLLEIPVTTMPLLKVPIHQSYLMNLGRFSESLMVSYLTLAVKLCKMGRTGLSFLLHPLDFLGADEAEELAFFPAMDLKKEKKLKMARKTIGILRDHFRILKMAEYAQELESRRGLKGLPL